MAGDIPPWLRRQNSVNTCQCHYGELWLFCLIQALLGEAFESIHVRRISMHYEGQLVENVRGIRFVSPADRSKWMFTPAKKL